MKNFTVEAHTNRSIDQYVAKGVKSAAPKVKFTCLC